CRLMELYYKGLKPVDRYRATLAEITSGMAYKQATTAEDGEAQKEQAQQDVYARDFREKDYNWWVAEVKRLNDEAQHTPDKNKATYNKRLLAYLSLVAFMNANAALNQQALPEATRFLNLYKLVDPTNTEWAYLSAVVAMRQQNQSAALADMKEAVKLGFADLDRIRVQAEFQGLQNDPEFNDLLSKINPE
ncbi:MAG TPA: hypothetical protein VNZ86_07255, partial [Bacteroidia bacterium]|nr:hypothetical protein [Bacteroidia bacterium]